MRLLRPRPCTLAALLVASSSPACLVPDSDHCAHRPGPLRGHAWCEQQDPDRPICSRCASAFSNEHAGCVAAEPDPACIVGEAHVVDDVEPSTSSTSEGSSATTTTDCVPSECEALDPSRPVCDAQGECARCTRTDPGACSGPTPICDEDAQACIPCARHSQCLEAVGSACNLQRGECLPPDRVWHVDGDAAAGGDGSEAAPFRKLSDAMARIPPTMDGAPAGQGTIVLHEASSAYAEAVAIGGGRLVAIVARGDDRPRIVLDTSSALITVLGRDTVAYLEGISLQSNPSGLGLRVQAEARAYVDRCEVTSSPAGIEVIEDGELELRNSVVTAGNAADVALLVDSARADVVYSTLVHRTIVSGSTPVPDGLRCTGDHAVSVRNSVVLAVDQDADGWDCPEAQVSHTAGEGTLLGADNVAVCTLPGFDCTTAGAVSSLFEDLAALRLSTLGADVLGGVSALAPGDPHVDIDLNPRAPERDFAGAHAPPD